MLVREGQDLNYSLTLSSLPLANEISMILMMMQAPSRLQSNESVFLQSMLHSPPETILLALVHSLNHEEKRANLKYRSTDKSAPASPVRYLTHKLRRRVLQWQPYQEGIDAPHHRPNREHNSYEPGYVPPGVYGAHAPYSLHRRLEGACRGGCEIFRFFLCQSWRYHNGMATCMSESAFVFEIYKRACS